MTIEQVKFVYQYIEAFFAAYLLVYAVFLIVSVTVGAVTLYERRQRNMTFNYIKHDYYMPISILVPAYNECITVVDTVESLLHLDYKLYEIVVIDDGSIDDTAKRLCEHFHLKKIHRPIRRRVGCKPEKDIFVSYDYKVPITLVCKVNGGKADALNMGVNVSEYPYVVCMDADSMLQHDALENIARCVMEHKDVVACGGMIRIVNNVTMDKGHVIDYRLPPNLILCMQVLEYDRSFLASRIFFDLFNGNLIISGAFGLFHKEFLINVGGYDTETMGEDMELVVRMHAFARANRVPYRICYATDAICWSQAPSTLHDLKKQRRRWHIGLFQSVFQQRQLLLNPTYGALSFISFAYFLIYELLSPYIEVFGVISILIAIQYNLINTPYMLMFLCIYAFLNAIMAQTAFFSRVHSMRIRLHWVDIIKAIAVSYLENIGLRAVLTWTRFTALIGYRKKRNVWGKIQRYHLKKPQQ